MDRLNYDIKTFGCKVNTYDSGLLQKRLAQAGFVHDESRPSVHILNTCAVTAEATKEAVRAIRRLKADNPFCTVVVTGCAAQVDVDQFEHLKGADLIVANSHKGDLENLIKAHLRGTLKDRVFRSNIFKKDDLEAGGGREVHHTRTFLKIQDGCNSFCTFCVIPFARGKSRSIAIADLVARAAEFESEGVREIVLTGVHIGDYEDESRPGMGRLEDLVEALLKNTRRLRFRLSSLEPIEVTERLLNLYGDSRLCPHFHMSIQSAQTRVLKAMKRQYSHVEVEDALNAIDRRVPGAFVGMDVIAGFPGETAEEFKETHDRLSSLPWTRIHVFPYSPRPGTYAMKLEPHWPREIILARAASLRELSHQRYSERALAQVGTVKRVLILKKPSKGAQGLSHDYWPVALDHVEALAGMEVDARVRGYHPASQPGRDGLLFAELS